MEVQIKLLGIDLIVEGLYYRGSAEERYYPVDNSEFEIEGIVLLNDSSQTIITDLLEAHEEKIKELVISKIEDNGF